MDEPRRRSELQKLQQGFLKLAEVDQLDFAGWVGDYLALPRPFFPDEAEHRKATLDCIRRAAAHLELTRPPKVEEYLRASRELELTWSWQKIHRLWGSFLVAAAVAFGKRAPASAQQRAFIGRFSPTSGAQREEHFTSVRLWLDTEPAAKTMTAYDIFAREYNYTLDDGELPLPRYGTMMSALALSWRDILAVAEGRLEHAEAVRERRDRPDKSHGPDDLIGLGTIALMRGLSKSQATQTVAVADFPRPALILAHRRIWLRDEVEAYVAGGRRPLMDENRLREHYLTAKEVSELLSISQSTLLKERARLPKAGMVGGIGYWMRETVDAYIAAHPQRTARRRQARKRPGTVNAKPRKTQYITKQGLADELGTSFNSIRTMTAEPGFPQPVARFGDAGVWFRNDVEDYLAARPVLERGPMALQELLVDSGALVDYLGLARRNFDSKSAAALGLPAPVARPSGKNVWLKDEIDAWLDADPRRCELRDRRLAQRARREKAASNASSRTGVG